MLHVSDGLHDDLKKLEEMLWKILFNSMKNYEKAQER